MLHWRAMRERAASQSGSPAARARQWAVYGFPFGKDVVMRTALLRHIPICPTYGLSEDPREAEKTGVSDQDAVLLTIPTEGEERGNVDVTDV